jgi:hypothetical protein
MRAVPWANSAEWNLVYTDLFSVDNQQRAIDRIKAWQSRGHVPISVESSMYLVHLPLDKLDPTEQRLLLAMAIIRFVNSIVDSLRKTSTSSVVVGQSVGLPSWIVELRHQATHDKLPPLAILMNARVKCVEWLHENYWRLQMDTHVELNRGITAWLSSYFEQRKLFMKNQGPDISSFDQLSGMITSFNFQEFLVPAFCSIILQKRYFLLIRSRIDPNGIQMHHNIAELWDPLLVYCNDNFSGFCDLVIDHLIGQFEEYNHTRKINAATWISHLVKRFLGPFANGTAILKRLLRPKNEMYNLITQTFFSRSGH